MSWGMVVGTGASMLVGAISGKGSKKRSQAAEERSIALEERGMALDENQFQWAKDIYGENKERYDPIFDEMRERMDDNAPDYGAIAGDIGKSFDSARGMEKREQRRYGISPTAGAAAQSRRDYGIRRGTAHVGARAKARRGAKDQQYARRSDLFNTGQGISSRNEASVLQAGQQSSAGMRDASRTASDRSDMYDRRSQESKAGWGQAVGSVDWGGLFSKVAGG